MMRKILLFLAFSGIIFAEDVAPLDGSAEILFPPEVAGGRLSLTGSGARIFTGNGWGKFVPGKIDLQLMWIDKADKLKGVIKIWSFDLPKGRFTIGAKRLNDGLMFTLTRIGDPTPLRNSECFKIEYWQKISPKSDVNEPTSQP